jgi:hypothetical protein
MKILPALLLIAGILLSPVASAKNPVTPLETFSKERGFSSLIAHKDEKAGTTSFDIVLNPAVFLSHFHHGFGPDRKTDLRVSLRSLDGDNFKGVSAELGAVISEVTEHWISFSVPTADLSHYKLEFQCSIPGQDGGVIIRGGELYRASLKDIREAKETITENSPVWRVMEEERRKHEVPEK